MHNYSAAKDRRHLDRFKFVRNNNSMSIVEEYKNQMFWRNWISYIEKLPIKDSDTILDLGCANGEVTKLISERCLQVIGIDFNSELLKEAEKTNFSHNIKYLNTNISNINKQVLPIVDGIWTSFTIAYFPEADSVLNTWLDIVKPGGWIAITEMSYLFAHFPLSHTTRDTFKK